MFDCHINVEICSTIKAVKYLYKYIYKGHDRVAFDLGSDTSNEQIDEIQQFQSARWIAPPEAMWRIYGFVVNEMWQSVYSLQLHLENQHFVTFQANDNLRNVVNLEHFSKSMLTQFFVLNQLDENARKYLYKKIPEHYVWNYENKEWNPRKKKQVIGRIVTANPLEGERYFLRILLNHVKGPMSFEDLRTVNGIIAPTYRDAATMLGLMLKDTTLDDCLQEAALFQMSFSLRRLFATILVYCNPTNPRELWERFEEDMSIDIKKRNECSSKPKRLVLVSIGLTLESMGKYINSYNLIDEKISICDDNNISKEICDELSIDIPEEDVLAITHLNSEQQEIYNTVLEKVYENGSGVFFIDGPGGTGKTFLYKALLAKVRSNKLVALATASSGVAASILPGGRTAHSRFKLPLNVDENNTCSVSKQSALADLLRLAKLIIWDETPMTRKQHIESLDKMLRDFNDCDLPFGGKVIVFGGDFRQVLSVVRKGTRQEQVNSSLVNSYLWPTLIKYNLKENMRAKLDPLFSKFVLAVGNGLPPTTINDTIKIPTNMLIPFKDEQSSLNELISMVFEDIDDYSVNITKMMDRAILTPKNNEVDDANTKISG